MGLSYLFSRLQYLFRWDCRAAESMCAHIAQYNVKHARIWYESAYILLFAFWLTHVQCT